MHDQPDRVNKGQQYALQGLTGRWAHDDKTRLWLLRRLIERPAKGFWDVTSAEWRRLRNAAYPYWRDGDWTTVDPDFAAYAADLVDEYRETILGQLRLF